MFWNVLGFFSFSSQLAGDLYANGSQFDNLMCEYTLYLYFSYLFTSDDGSVHGFECLLVF